MLVKDHVEVLALYCDRDAMLLRLERVICFVWNSDLQFAEDDSLTGVADENLLIELKKLKDVTSTDACNYHLIYNLRVLLNQWLFRQVEIDLHVPSKVLHKSWILFVQNILL